MRIQDCSEGAKLLSDQFFVQKLHDNEEIFARGRELDPSASRSGTGNNDKYTLRELGFYLLYFILASRMKISTQV